MSLGTIAVLSVLGLILHKVSRMEVKTASFMSVPTASHSILYVRTESHQAQRGFSVIMRGGEFRPLTNTYEWWVDSQNPWRFRRATTEWLEDGPHLIGADGSDGVSTWWIVDWPNGITMPQRHQGRYPLLEGSSFGGTDISLEDWITVFEGQGKRWIEAGRSGKAREVGRVEKAPWGQATLFQQSDAEGGYVTTATVKAEAPNLLLEKIILDRDGELYETYRLVSWEWLDPTQLDADFWMTPPKNAPLGP